MSSFCTDQGARSTSPLGGEKHSHLAAGSFRQSGLSQRIYKQLDVDLPEG
jgi:hypothetical protein